MADRELLTRRIKDAVDIVGVIGSYLTLKRAGASYKGLCPFHEEKSPSFFVHPAKQFFKCYGCNAGGDVFHFLQLREKVDFIEARRMLAERAGISLEAISAANASSGPGKTDLARANQWALRVFRRNYESESGLAARQYVDKRGISTEIAGAFQLGFAPDGFEGMVRQSHVSKVDLRLLSEAGLVKERTTGGYYDTFRNRLMFPIADATGRIIGFGGRTMGDDPAKYLNTPATALFDKSTHLFGLDKARQAIADKGRAIVVEGYTDCIMAHQHGFCETVATLGTAMTEQHAALLRRFTDKVVLLFDSDEAGQRAADRALGVTLSGGLDVSLARVPEGKDPCDYLLSAGTLGFEQVLKEAIPALEFKWRLVAREYQISATGPGRRRAIDAYLQSLGWWIGHGAIDSIQMGLLVNQLSALLSLPGEELHAQLSTLSRRAPAVARPGQVSTAGGRTHASQHEAIREILEVVLNEPEYYRSVSQYLDPKAIRSPELAMIAQQLSSLVESSEPFSVGDLMSRFELPAFARLVADLQERGEKRGRYQEVIAGAIRCLESATQARRTSQIAGDIRSQKVELATDHNPALLSDEEQLLALAASARNPHFASPRARKKFLDS